MTQTYNLPKKFLDRLVLLAGDNADKILRTFEQEKPVALRINTLKISKEYMIDILNKAGISYQEVPWYENALVIQRQSKKNITALTEYANGDIYIQNLSSMIPPIILDAKPGENILDITAAPGSKTTQIAQMMDNTGTIVANDISRQRLYKMEAILRLLGVTNVKISRIPGEFIWKKYPNYFDKVLIDAPCTMEGRFDVHDENSFKDWSLKKVKVLSYLQKRLLRSAFYSVKPGGTIVYSTCTLSPEENEGVANYLLEEEGRHVELEKINIKGLTRDLIKSEWLNEKFDQRINSAFRIMPSNIYEGFFIAKFKRLS